MYAESGTFERAADWPLCCRTSVNAHHRIGLSKSSLNKFVDSR
jgi:hypothetical protein